MPIIPIEVPDGNNCTGCPCSLILPHEVAQAENQLWAFGCTIVHDRCNVGGEYSNYAIKHEKCPSLKRHNKHNKPDCFNTTYKSNGGVVRAQNLTPERRSEIAQMGANARWGKTD
jgi:hypothetical protein